MTVHRYSHTDGADIQSNGDPFIKRPYPVWMVQPPHDDDFEVETAEGVMTGHPGDWLCYDPISQHVWVVTDEYKSQHYDRMPDDVAEAAEKAAGAGQ